MKQFIKIHTNIKKQSKTLVSEKTGEENGRVEKADAVSMRSCILSTEYFGFCKLA